MLDLRHPKRPETPDGLKLALRRKTAAEFFAGIGLMRMGLEAAGWSVAFANDIAPDKFRMYDTHFKDAAGHFLLEDIHAVTPDQVPTVAMATASFPCNDLSLAGARKGLRGKQSSAYWGFIRILEGMADRRPPIVFLENVAGFLTSNGGRDFREALLALNRLGYAVDALVVDASRFVPQSRVRLFIIGSLKNGDEDRHVFGKRAVSESDIRPGALVDFIGSYPEIDWDIRDLPPIEMRRRSLETILEDLPPDTDYWWSDDRRDYLLSQMSDRHAKAVKEMKSAQKWSYGTVFRRVRKGKTMAEIRTDGIAGCLRTPRGGSGRQILLQAGFGTVKVRLLTPRECARLMGADDFTIETPLNQALFGFGDAVCVPVIAWIAKHYLNPLAEDLKKNSRFEPDLTHSRAMHAPAPAVR